MTTSDTAEQGVSYPEPGIRPLLSRDIEELESGGVPSFAGFHFGGQHQGIPRTRIAARPEEVGIGKIVKLFQEGTAFFSPGDSPKPVAGCNRNLGLWFQDQFGYEGLTPRAQHPMHLPKDSRPVGIEVEDTVDQYNIERFVAEGQALGVASHKPYIVWHPRSTGPVEHGRAKIDPNHGALESHPEGGNAAVEAGSATQVEYFLTWL